MAQKTKQRSLGLGLLVGDLGVLFFSLWLTLVLRYGHLPKGSVFAEHLGPFALIFAVWLLVFYMADLYGRLFYLYRKSLLGVLFAAQAVNGLVAAAFFYFLPFYGITPKTVLFIDLAVSFLLVLAWRSLVRALLNLTAKENLIIIGNSSDFVELAKEIGRNERYGFNVLKTINHDQLADNFDRQLRSGIDSLVAKEKNIVLVVESFKDLPKEAVAYFYDLMFKGVEFFDFQNLYESIFQHVPMSCVNDEWLLANISSGRKPFYDLPKRAIDILASLVFGLISLIFYPFIFFAIKLYDWGPIFYNNERVGQNNEVFKQLKFRSMRVDADARWPEKNDKRITPVGRWLRKTRLDELPQLWNVFLGDMSFVGPRPDFLEFAKTLENKISYYNVRNLIKPGLTGWAQIQQEAVPTSVAETQQRLAYDIYYLKNRSLFLDLEIILKTVGVILSRSGV